MASNSVNNILAVWARASEQERHAGAVWYTTAHAVARHLAFSHELPLATTAGVIAALSPRNRWERNLADAAVLLQSGADAAVCTFKAQKDKALCIVSRKPTSTEDVADMLGKGPKTRAFFHTIYDPQTRAHVVVDGHAAAIARGERKPLSECKVSEKDYGTLTSAYSEAAAAVSVIPSTMQATTWVTWRRLHGVS